MALSLQLVQKQTQRLIMTPQMQQSIQLLQLNTIELEQLAEAELLENPFLETEDESSESSDDPSNGAEPGTAEAPTADAAEAPAETAAEPATDARDDPFSTVEAEVSLIDKQIDELQGAGATEAAEPAANQAEEAPAEPDDTPPRLEDEPAQFAEVDVNWEDFYEGAENRTYTREPEEAQTDFQEYTAARKSLYDHLMWQLRLCVLEGVDAEIGEYLIGCLDEDGFLEASSIEDAAIKFDVEPEAVDRVLSIVQEFEPVGIGARTSAECLLLQMDALGSYTDTARQVLEDHFTDLQRKNFKDIAKAVDADVDEIVEIYHAVSRLEPKPGRSYSKESIQYISADVTVRLIDGELTIYLNEGSSGRLSVSRLYRRMMRLQDQALTPEEKAYTVEKFRGALMLIKNIEKRKSTILRVTEAIMNVQGEFLTKGVEALKPLTLREIADIVGMHESTIARVTSRKYVDTPQGLYSLKYFFSSSISTSNAGGAVSSRSIKEKLLILIDGEDSAKPLSDQKIADDLNKQGYNIARRTVAKYREQLRVLPAKMRKKA